jgi:hypothetical protein
MIDRVGTSTGSVEDGGADAAAGRTRCWAVEAVRS